MPSNILLFKTLKDYQMEYILEENQKILKSNKNEDITVNNFLYIYIH